MKNSSLLAFCVLSSIVAVVRAADAPAAAPAAGPYHYIKDIHIGGAPSTDYLTVDPEGKRLYVSHGNSVAVVDIEKDVLVGEIADLSGVHGVAIAPKAGLGFASNGQGGNVSIFDLKTLKVTKTVPTGQNPDWIFYEPGQNEVYAFNGRSLSATVIDVAKGEVVATIPLGGKPEAATSDPAAGRVYNNIEDKAEVAVIDTKTHTVVAHWPNAPAKGASGQAIDLAHHRLILGCDDTMALMDSTNGKVLSTLPAAPGIDSAAFDPGTGYAITPGGSGNGGLTIAKVVGDKLTLVQSLTTATRAKTIALDPTTHRIYTATVKYEAPAAGAAPQPAAASGSASGGRGGRGGARGGPAAVADSFRVMVYGLEAAPDAKK